MATYKSAGVNIDAGNKLVSHIKKMVPGIGSFSGAYPLFADGYRKPLLVSSSDGVGTKLKLAFLLRKHDTVGIDLVAMNVNDLICCGARPLFFLDYFACGRLNVSQARQVIQGIVAGCKQAGCRLLGGETAEMPGFYKKGEYDLAGFAVGAVEKEMFIGGKKISSGDLIIGLPSSGLHSNGFSLVRKVFSASGLKKYGSVLLRPTKIYVKEILNCLARSPKNSIKGIVHITGGGFYDNIPRVIPKQYQAVINKSTWHVPAIFQRIQAAGHVMEREMYRTFNMGIGMTLVISPRSWPGMRRRLPGASLIGHIEKGKNGVVLTHG